MRSARALFCLLLTSISFCFLPTSKAQQDYLLELGTPPGSPSMPIPMGVVNPQNGNVHLEFPLRTYVQRNGLKVTAKLTYDSRNCYQNPTATTSTWLCWSGWQEVYSPFQGGLNPYPPFIPTNQTTAQCPAGGPNGGFWYNRIIWTNFTFTDATGTSHLMNVTMDSSGSFAKTFKIRFPPAVMLMTALDTT